MADFDLSALPPGAKPATGYQRAVALEHLNKALEEVSRASAMLPFRNNKVAVQVAHAALSAARAAVQNSPSA